MQHSFTHMHKMRGKSLLAITLGLLLLGTAPAHAVDGALPGGTSISVEITGVAGDPSIVSGTASVEAGDPIKDTTVVYVIDISGSMSASALVDCTGDGIVDTRIVCTKQAIKAANQAASDPFSSIGLAGMVTFHTGAQKIDVDLSASLRFLVAPAFDGNGNSIADIEEQASLLSLGSLTNYHDGMIKAIEVLNDPANTNNTNLVIFLSDGINGIGNPVHTLASMIPANTTIKSFAIGDATTCTYTSFLGNLQAVANLSTTSQGACQVVTDMSQLGNAITQSIGSTLNSLDISVDGATAVAISNADIAPGLPQDGPITVNYATSIGSLSHSNHEVCVTAHGTDAGGDGSVTDCSMVDLSLNVLIDIKPGSSANPVNVEHGNGIVPVAILGSATFDVSFIDRSTLKFGPGEAAPKHKSGGHLQDVNHDGYMDLLGHYPIQDSGLVAGDASACVRGMLSNGVDHFVGCDSLRTVPVR
ncbi:MAG: VWA domain-containing protein [Gammaproteobacteria bacterium]|nr:VWA domain-containing protein [Gammaproteobacteria bacterium]